MRRWLPRDRKSNRDVAVVNDSSMMIALAATAADTHEPEERSLVRTRVGR